MTNMLPVQQSLYFKTTCLAKKYGLKLKMVLKWRELLKERCLKSRGLLYWLCDNSLYVCQVHRCPTLVQQLSLIWPWPISELLMLDLSRYNHTLICFEHVKYGWLARQDPLKREGLKMNRPQICSTQAFSYLWFLLMACKARPLNILKRMVLKWIQ